MAEVVLHVYDVTNAVSDSTNETILQINKLFKDGIGVGGIFYSAIQVHGPEEWSFRSYQEGTGVYSCPAGKNPIFKYRERIVLGKTHCSTSKTSGILKELSKEWSGDTYNVLTRNCNHFCDELCSRLGAPKLPSWVNRFARVGNAPLEMVENTSLQLKQAKANVAAAGKSAFQMFSNAKPAYSAVVPRALKEKAASGAAQMGWVRDLISSGANSLTGPDTK